MSSSSSPRPRCSHREIARQTGFSSATVSLALSSHPRISEATRRKIEEVAAALGYAPNAELAQVMKVTQKRHPAKPVIALLTNQPEPSPWETHVYLKRFYDSVTERASELGYRIEEFWMKEPGMTARRLSQILHARGTAGLIIPPAFAAAKRLPLKVDSLAVGVHGRVFWKPQLHRVQADHLFNTMLALKEILKLGYERIGIATFYGTDKAHGHEIESAYAYYHTRQLMPSFIPPFHCDGLDMEGFWEWFEQHRPQVILSSFPGILEGLRNHGVRVPEDVGLACLGVIPELGDMSGIDINAASTDRALVDVVVAQIVAGERGVPRVPRATLVEGFWKAGGTLRKIRGTNPG